MASRESSGPDDLPSPPAKAQSISIHPTTDGLQCVRDSIDEALRDADYDRTNAFAVRVALEEALCNAARHGCSPEDPNCTIEVVYHVTPEDVYLRITDNGPGFDPTAIPDPTLDENLESATGRGLLLMRAYMNSVQYSPSGNCVVMTRKVP